MADKKFSGATAATSISATDEFPFASGGVSKKITGGDLAISLGLLTANTQTASYVLALTDANLIVEMNVASGNTLTVPANATVAFPVGTLIEVFQMGVGQTTIVAAGGVTINSPNGLKLIGQYSSATLRKRATNEWVVAGDCTT